MHIDEEMLWQMLRVEPVSPSNEPVDASFIRLLITNAEARAERFIGGSLDDFETLPAELEQAIMIDVATNYFNRLSPDLPDAYWQLLMPFRSWSFGRAIEEA